MSRQGQIVPLFGRGFTSKSPVVTRQLLTNMYREPEQSLQLYQIEQDKTAMALFPTPGATLVNQITSSPCRGAIVVANQTAVVVLAVHNNQLLLIQNWTIVGVLLTLQTSSGRVGMAFNGTQCVVVDGVAGYYFNVSTFSGGTITNPNFPNGATTVTFLAGYFVVDDPSAFGRFRWSASFDGSTWNASDFATAEFSPFTALVAVYALGGYLYLFGARTTEIWAASGDTSVFKRVGGAGLQYGLIAKWAICEYKDSSLAYLARSTLGQAVVVRLLGFSTQFLSSPESAHDLNLQQVGAVTMSSYLLDTHGMLQLNCPTISYLYDDLSGAWSEVSSTGSQYNGRHLGEIHLDFLGVPYVSDFTNGNWYKVDPTNYTDNGATIIREIVSRHIFANYERLSIAELFVDFETGVGRQGSGQGSAPVVMMSWSKDGGRTFGTETFQSLGAIGQYLTRVFLRMIGRAYDFVLKMRISDPVKVVVVGASARMV